MTTLNDISQKASQLVESAKEHANDINVGKNERTASVIAGGVLLMAGLRRRSTFGALLAIIGGRLIYRGATGHCTTYAALGKNTAEHSQGE